MTQTQAITVVGCIGAAALAVGPMMGGQGQVVCTVISAACGAVCAYLTKGKGYTGKQ